MNDSFGKKVASRAQDLAKKAAKQVTYEKEEYLKSAKVQVGIGVDSSQKSLVDEIVGQNGKTVNTQEQSVLNAQKSRRLEELEGEIEELRRERQKSQAQWSQDQDAAMTESQADQPTPLVIPESRPKRGMIGGAAQRKKKQGTREIGKSVSG